MYSFSPTQVVPSYTHMTPSGTPTLIDIAMLSDIDHLKSCTTVPSLSTSDHLGVSLTLTLKLYIIMQFQLSNHEVFGFTKMLTLIEHVNSLRKLTGTPFSLKMLMNLQ